MLIQEEHVGKITFRKISRKPVLVSELLFWVFTLSLQHVNEKRGLGLPIMGTIYTWGACVPVGLLKAITPWDGNDYEFLIQKHV